MQERTERHKALRPAAPRLLLVLGAGLLAIGLSGGGRGGRVLLLQDVEGELNFNTYERHKKRTYLHVKSAYLNACSAAVCMLACMLL